MPSTLTAPASQTASTQAAQPGPARRSYLRPLWLGVLLASLMCSGLIYAYLQYGWFESAHRGQVLQIRRMHAEGPRYRVQRPWGVFPRAHRLLHDTFTNNAWTIISTDGEVLYQHLPNWWTVPLSQVPQQVCMAFVLRIAYRTTWGERTEAQRYAIARMLVERFGVPWQHVAPDSLTHLCSAFTVDETVPPAQHSHQVPIRPRITFVVWAGYDDNRPAGLYGGRVHRPILRRFLSEKRVQAVLRALLQEKP